MRNETIRQVLRRGEALLTDSGIQDAEFDAFCLLQQALETDATHLRLHYPDAAEPAAADRFLRYIRRRASGEPLQYILGEWDFCGRSFSVGSGVLIPRPETEFLVSYAVRRLPYGGTLFDVCAGSGCIGISVALERPDVRVTLIEKYDEPLRYCFENIRKNNANNVAVLQSDMMEEASIDLPAPDGIVSNPPYIETDALAFLQAEVQREPREALDGGTDGLSFYRALRKRWFPLLREGGFLAVECGEGQPRAVAAMFSPDAQIARDYLDTERFVTIICHGKDY